MPAYTSLDDAVSRLAATEEAFRQAKDRRSIFLTAYLIISTEIRGAVRAGRFIDKQWMERYAVAFANLYRQALDFYESGDLGSVPKSWRLAFDAARAGRTLVAQDLLLGVNAHINHDLALALHQVSIDPDRETRRRDHNTVNEILRAATDRLQDRISTLYAAGLAGVDAAAGRLDEEVSGFSVEVARDGAWEAAVSLANARNDLERALVRKRLDLQAGVLARLLLAPSLSPILLNKLRNVEQATPWWEYISLPASVREELT